MSRCFPYPPPGYTLSIARKEALIESIKLQKQKVNDEELRKKDKKREKKEKRKEKKDKKEKKEKKDKKEKDNKHHIVQGHDVEKLWAQSKVEPPFDKGSKTESEQLERSSLTEEHEKPVCLRVPSTSSDSTENSNKRKRPSSPGDVSHGHGNIIRIRLPLKKQKQLDASPNEQQPCSTSGRTHFPSQAKSDFASRLRTECQLASKNVEPSLVLKIDKQRICPTSKQTKQIVKTPVSLANDVVMTPMKKEESLYANLIENWVPPQLQNGCLSLDDNDWLFSSKNERRRVCRDDIISSCSTRSSTLWPVATFLPEVDVFALPFTVPF